MFLGDLQDIACNNLLGCGGFGSALLAVEGYSKTCLGLNHEDGAQAVCATAVDGALEIYLRVRMHEYVSSKLLTVVMVGAANSGAHLGQHAEAISTAHCQTKA